MMLPLWIFVALLGIVEGLTEFIPVSSTGHLILASAFLGFQDRLMSDANAALFDVFIQSGAILAVGAIYREKLVRIAISPWTRSASKRSLLVALILAFLPAAFIGLMAHHFIERYLFSPLTVAWALIVGGILLLAAERLPIRHTTHSTDNINYRQALLVGIAQVFSLFPGASRSGMTIIGGLAGGMDRRTATEFSFLLSFPTMFAASGFVLLKHIGSIDVPFAGVLLAGFVTAFLSAWIVIKWFIHFVQSHTFTIFAVYRITIGVLLLYYFWRWRQ